MDFSLEEDDEGIPTPTLSKMDEIYHYDRIDYKDGETGIRFVGSLTGLEGSKFFVVVHYDISLQDGKISGSYHYCRSWKRIHERWLGEMKPAIDEKIRLAAIGSQ